MCSRWPGHSCIQTAAGRHSVPHCSAQGNVNHHGEKGGGGRQSESPLTRSPWGYTQTYKDSAAFAPLTAVELLDRAAAHRQIALTPVRSPMQRDTRRNNSVITRGTWKQASTCGKASTSGSLCWAPVGRAITGWQCWAATEGAARENASEQGSTEDIIKTQINGHNLERDSARVRVIISLVSCAASESKHCKH